MKKVPEHNAIIIRHDISILSRLDSTCHTQYIRFLTLFVLYQSSKCTGIIRLPDSTNTVKLHKKLKSHTRVTNDVYTSTAHKHTDPLRCACAGIRDIKRTGRILVALFFSVPHEKHRETVFVRKDLPAPSLPYPITCLSVMKGYKSYTKK